MQRASAPAPLSCRTHQDRSAGHPVHATASTPAFPTARPCHSDREEVVAARRVCAPADAPATSRRRASPATGSSRSRRPPARVPVSRRRRAAFPAATTESPDWPAPSARPTSQPADQPDTPRFPQPRRTPERQLPAWPDLRWQETGCAWQPLHEARGTRLRPTSWPGGYPKFALELATPSFARRGWCLERRLAATLAKCETPRPRRRWLLRLRSTPDTPGR